MILRNTYLSIMAYELCLVAILVFSPSFEWIQPYVVLNNEYFIFMLPQFERGYVSVINALQNKAQK